MQHLLRALRSRRGRAAGRGRVNGLPGDIMNLTLGGEVDMITIRAVNQERQKEMLEAARGLAKELVRHGAEFVVLFGSLVDRDRAAPDADVDMVVVMPGVERQRFHERPDHLPGVDTFPYPLHLLVYAPAEWARVRERAFVRDEVLGKGIVLHERNG